MPDGDNASGGRSSESGAWWEVRGWLASVEAYILALVAVVGVIAATVVAGWSWIYLVPLAYAATVVVVPYLDNRPQ